MRFLINLLLLIILFNIIYGMPRKDKDKGKSRLGQPDKQNKFVKQFSFSSHSDGAIGQAIAQPVKNVANKFKNLLNKTKGTAEKAKKVLQRNMSEIVIHRKEYTQDKEKLLKKLKTHSDSENYLNELIKKLGEIEEKIEKDYSKQKNTVENLIDNFTEITKKANLILNEIELAKNEVKGKLIEHLLSNELEVKEEYIKNIESSINEYAKFEREKFKEIDELRLKDEGYIYLRELFPTIKNDWLTIIYSNKFEEIEEKTQELMKQINDEAKEFYRDFSDGCKLVGWQSKILSNLSSEIGHSGELSVSSEQRSTEEIFEEQAQEIRSESNRNSSERSVSSTNSRKSSFGKAVLMIATDVPVKKFETSLAVCEENIIPLWEKLLEKRRTIRDFYYYVKSSQENFIYLEKDRKANDKLFITPTTANSSGGSGSSNKETFDVQEMNFVLYQIKYKPLIIYLIYRYEKINKLRGSINFKNKEESQCKEIANKMLKEFYDNVEITKIENTLLVMIKEQFGLKRVAKNATFDPYGPQCSFYSEYLNYYFYFIGQNENDKKGKNIVNDEKQKEIEESVSTVSAGHSGSGHICISSPSNDLINLSDDNVENLSESGQQSPNHDQIFHVSNDGHNYQNILDNDEIQPSNPPYSSSYNPFYYGQGSTDNSSHDFQFHNDIPPQSYPYPVGPQHVPQQFPQGYFTPPTIHQYPAGVPLPYQQYSHSYPLPPRPPYMPSTNPFYTNTQEDPASNQNWGQTSNQTGNQSLDQNWDQTWYQNQEWNHQNRF